MAKFTNVSELTKQQRTMEFPQYTQEEFDKRYAAWVRNEMSIEQALPDLTNSQLSFIKTGVTNSEWEEYLASDQSDQHP